MAFRIYVNGLGVSIRRFPGPYGFKPSAAVMGRAEAEKSGIFDLGKGEAEVQINKAKSFRTSVPAKTLASPMVYNRPESGP